ncbi:adenosylhomocysteine nucleosidase [Pseudobutyrivibrio sp. YE44]|uniref:5'-methylthioadenosine/S-adenosylhomocysteine nucleosidase n=1 Tax=Pseudobutyrivibrio sp. YE44 TaxID=1520802 RepID=UPI000888E3BF|nr:5'-methylthioadenosine/S-adenosylhomocysteine nucleosidase [Pseudobutyrivibrio sp. YE44]SDB14776.1 adenosylhomocysteine nucleosidase [Pseudobutyrivibrio sp. YE44]
MKKVLIVSALDKEVENLEKYILKKDIWRKIGENQYINDNNSIEVYVKVLGVGKVNAAFQTADAINYFSPDLIVNIGVAGGLDDDLKVGSVVIGKEYVQVDLKTLLPENFPTINGTPAELITELSKIAEEKGVNYKTGRLATGDFVLFEGRKRRQIKKQFKPLSFDMETAAIAQVATAKDIDFVGIRSFSDMANRKTIKKLSLSLENDEKKQKLKEKVFGIPGEIIVDYIEKIS